jgi:hypothetical protein
METIETIRDQLYAVVNASSDATLGEALNNVNEQIYRTILSGLPKLNLISFTKCPIRHSFASAARAGFGTARISAALALWASQDGSSGYPMLAVGRTSRGFPCRVSWLQNDQRYTIATFDPLSGSPTSVPEEVDVNWLIDALDSGTIIPGSRLASLLEVALRQTGVSVKHFGNNYGRLQQAAALFQRLYSSEAPWEDILICEDDEDSWLVAEVRGESLSYPIHLMDMLLTKAESSATMQGYVDTSLNQRAPVVLRPRSTLGETILDRRP